MRIRTRRRRNENSFASFLCLLLCLVIFAGATYAIFTSESNNNIGVSSGKVEVVAKVTDLKLFSHRNININTLVGEKYEVEGTAFPNSGTASYANGKLTLDRLTPGDGVTFNISITNNSNVAIKYRTVISAATGSNLIDALKVTIGDNEYHGEVIGAWTDLEAEGTIDAIPVSIEFPTDADNDYLNLSLSISIKVEAVQGNVVDPVDAWDGTVGELSDDLIIESAAELAAFAASVNAGDTYEGKTVYLNSGIDLAGAAWTPINSFAGTLDGQGHTISNLKDAALFNTISGEVKNLNLKGVSATDKTQFASFAHTVSGKLTNCSVDDVDITVTVANHGGAVAGFVQTVAEGAVIDGCKVSDVTINLTDASKNCSDGEGGVIGGVAAGATVQNCEFTSIKLSAAGRIKRGGGIFGSVSGKVSGCTVNGVTVSTTWSTDQAGGFAGIVNGGAEITDIILNNVNLDIVYGNNLGGLMGKVGTAGQSDITLKNITTNGLKMKVVEYTQNVGGFIGQVDYRTNDSRLIVDNCHINDLDMTLASDKKTGESPVAGFISCINGGADITGCSVDGRIDGTNELLGIGGFLGDIGGYGAANAYTVNITDCKADVAITGNDNIMVGGFAAYAGSYRQTNTHTLNFTNCEAKGSFYGALDSDETSNFTGCKVDGAAFTPAAE